VEVCDPCESGKFAYQVNGVLVSDFITPQFYDPVQSFGVRYSFTGAIKSPRSILDDGYISWQDPKTDKWMQLTMFGGQAQLVDLSSNAKFAARIKDGNPRSAVDAVTDPPRFVSGLRGKYLMAAREWSSATREGQKARAKSLLGQIADMNKRTRRAAAAKRKARRPSKK
jgi:hypothetical protein